jgi:TPP-dependent trihydroxycyclohexane-1,2-dione (THcHDO) dehydratase
MQVAYQSEEPDDTSSYDATISSIADEEEEEDEEESEEEESGSQVTDADVDRQPETEVENQWWQNLGPRTRRKARVNYTEEKIIPAQSTSKV